MDVSSAPITDLGLRGLGEDGTLKLPFLNRIAFLDTQVSTYVTVHYPTEEIALNQFLI